MRALVIEDDLGNRRYLTHYLTKFGDVLEAPNGKVGIDLFLQTMAEGKTIDVVFLDVFMPEQSGHEVQQVIREWEKEHQIPYKNRVKLILATGAAETEYVLEGFRLGCDLYLPKPFTASQISGFLKEIGYLPLEG